MPHIVHVLSSLAFGGAEQLVFNLVTHPKLQHFQHSIICVNSDQGEFRKKFERFGISIYFCPVYWPTFKLIPSYRTTVLTVGCNIILPLLSVGDFRPYLSK